MKLLGEKIFARDAEGNLVSRIGTLFLRTPGLVTRRGVHAMQRQMWIDELNRERDADHPLTLEEEDAELLSRGNFLSFIHWPKFSLTCFFFLVS